MLVFLGFCKIHMLRLLKNAMICSSQLCAYPYGTPYKFPEIWLCRNACFSRVLQDTHVGGFSKILCFVVVSSMEIPSVPPKNLLKSCFAKMLVFLAFCKIHMLGASQKCYGL